MNLICERKILNIESLIETMRQRGSKKLVHCHGCFDFLHPGHIHHFEFAKRLGDLLLVSFNGDEFFVNKGPGRPLFNERFRAVAIAALEVVDYVCIYPGFVPERIFEEVKPDVYVKGIEYDWRRGAPKIPEEEWVTRYGGKVVYGPEDMIYSSTKFIDALSRCQVS